MPLPMGLGTDKTSVLRIAQVELLAAFATRPGTPLTLASLLAVCCVMMWWVSTNGYGGIGSSTSISQAYRPS